ncbi:MAG: MBL fold metallo-hydrolase [Dehalococcoidia bacterium]
MPEIDLLLQGYTLGTSEGSAAFCGVTLIRSTKTILVDVAHTGRRELLLTRLKERGLTPDDIDMVVLTHAHWDHMLNIDLFPNAEVLLSENERKYASNPDPADWGTPSYTGMILERMRLREVRERDEIDAGVRVLDTPGHSPGSITLLVDQDYGTAGITGDALPNARCALAGTPYLIFHDETLARESAAKIKASCRALYPGHDRPFRLDGDIVTYLTPTSIRITTQLEPGQSDVGVTLSAEAPRPIWALKRSGAKTYPAAARLPLPITGKGDGRV